jgi:hypothetical protein
MKLPTRPRTAADNGHVLYETADNDAPDVIMDRNGVVVLGLCRICGRAEIELSEPCGEPNTERK